MNSGQSENNNKRKRDKHDGGQTGRKRIIVNTYATGAGYSFHWAYNDIDDNQKRDRDRNIATIERNWLVLGSSWSCLYDRHIPKDLPRALCDLSSPWLAALAELSFHTTKQLERAKDAQHRMMSKRVPEDPDAKLGKQDIVDATFLCCHENEIEKAKAEAEAEAEAEAKAKADTPQGQDRPSFANEQSSSAPRSGPAASEDTDTKPNVSASSPLNNKAEPSTARQETTQPNNTSDHVTGEPSNAKPTATKPTATEIGTLKTGNATVTLSRPVDPAAPKASGKVNHFKPPTTVPRGVGVQVPSPERFQQTPLANLDSIPASRAACLMRELNKRMSEASMRPGKQMTPRAVAAGEDVKKVSGTGAKATTDASKHGVIAEDGKGLKGTEGSGSSEVGDVSEDPIVGLARGYAGMARIPATGKAVAEFVRGEKQPETEEALLPVLVSTGATVDESSTDTERDLDLQEILLNNAAETVKKQNGLAEMHKRHSGGH